MATGDYKRAKEISEKTKEKVLKRQEGRSITGVMLYPGNTDFHHVRFRSDSGVGYEWNVVAITREEHSCYHDHLPIKVNGRERYTWDEFNTLIKNHLILRYKNWEWDKCRYHKYWKEEDYGIVARSGSL